MASVFSLIRQIYIGATLNPIEFGFYNFMFLLLTYSNYADLGINNGALHESTRTKGSDDTVASRVSIENGFSATFFLGLVISVLIFGLSLVQINIVQEHQVILRLASLLIITTIVYNYYHIDLRVNERFSLLSSSIIVAAVAGLIFSIIFGEVYEKNNAEWMLFGWILGIGTAVIYLSMYIKLKPKLKIDYRLVTKFIRIGIPLTILPIILSTFFAIDRWVLVTIANPKMLGYYALGCTFGMALYMIPNSLGTILLTTFLKNSGTKKIDNKTAESLLFLNIAITASSYFMAIILGITLISIPFALHYIFPEYADGLQIITIVITAYTIISWLPPLNTYLIAYDEVPKLSIILLFGLIFSGILSFIGHKYFGISGTGYFLIVTFAATILSVLLLVSMKGKIEDRWTALRLFNLFFPFAAILQLVYFITPLIEFINIYDDLFLLTKLLLIFIFISCTILIVHAHLSGFLNQIKNNGVKSN